jgi:hypothetical protein
MKLRAYQVQAQKFVNKLQFRAANLGREGSVYCAAQRGWATKRE